MKLPILAVSALALLSSPALSQTAPPASPAKPGAPAAQSTAPAASSQVAVAAARRLVGEDVRAKDGKELGEIEYLMVGVNDGQVRYAIVEPEEGDPDQVVPVPWGALQMRASGRDIQLVVDRDRFAKQKRFKTDDIAGLTQSETVTSIYEYWVPVMPQGQGHAGAAAGKEGEKAKTAQGTTGQGTPHFLVDRDVITTVYGPAFRTAAEMRGSEVFSSDDKEYGDIDDLMIDLKRGRVAYVQIGHGGFLGLGEEITPVPFGALTYDDERNAYRLGKSEAELEKVERFARTDEPTSVRSSDLGKLYRDFGIRPYWEDKS